MMNHLIESVGTFLWGWPMIILLLGTHLYLTVRLKFPQRRIFKAIRLSIQKDDGSPGDVSQFGALATSLAATIGTGNIVGVATAVALGGPGAIFWCWITGVLGIATKYGEGLLAVKYRVKTRTGKMIGGPMFALQKGLGMKWLAVLFCIFTAMASFGIGNMVQSNAISMLCHDSMGIPTWMSGLAVTLLAALVILFGVKGIARVCTAFVPLMALLYVLGCIYILCVNASFIWPAIQLILRTAFQPEAGMGGAVGSSLILTARYGIARGLFSNESGMGSAPIVAAAAQTRNPVRQALVSSSATFWDTVVICLLTGLVIVSTLLAYDIDLQGIAGGSLTREAFSRIPFVGSPLLTFGVITFAFSTILGWSYYGERAVEYLAGRRLILLYRLLFIVAIFLGSLFELTLVWNLSDLMNALMAIPNLFSLLLLSGVIVHETKKYGKDL